MSHAGIDPNMWNNISFVNPNDGIRYAYVARNRQSPNCNPNPLWTGCFFIGGQNFNSPGGTFQSLNGSLQVGQFISVYYPQNATQCLEILKIIDEAEFNSGLGIMNCPSDFTNTHGTFNGCPCNIIYGDLAIGSYLGAGTPVIFYDCSTCIVSVVNQDVSGCTDTLATNYNVTATIDDGSCIYKWKCDHDVQGNPTGNPCYIDPTGTWNNQIDCDNYCSVPQDDCDCVPIPGTGHTGSAGGINPGYFDYTAYTLCYSACCGDSIVLPDCAVFLADRDLGVKYYDHISSLSYDIFSPTPTTTHYDIAAMENYIWVYNNNIIEEYYTPNLNLGNYSLNRTLGTGGFSLGRGLRAKGPTFLGSTQLFSAGENVRLIDFPLPPQQGGPAVANPNAVTTTINVTQLFPLPNGYVCLGDVMYDSNSGNLMVAYGSPQQPPTAQFLGVFTLAGNLIDEINLQNVGFDVEEWVDGLYSYMPPGATDSCRHYLITNFGNVHGINQTPYLSVTPWLQTASQAFNPITYIYGATSRADKHCECDIIAPPTYNCTDTYACVDPGNGTGFFTGVTALQDCQAVCEPPMVTWDCSPASYVNNCSAATQQLPYPLVNNATTAMDYIANSINGLQQSSFNTITWGMPPYQTTLSVCTGSQGEFLHRIAFIRHPQVFGNTQYYTWDSFLFAAILSGAIPGPLSGLQNASFLQVNNLFYQHTNSYIDVLVGKPCLCYMTDCYCYPVTGGTGQYPSQAACIPPCCDVDDGYMCEQGMGCFPCIGSACQFTGPTAYQDCLAACPIQHYYDCDDMGYCVGLINGVVGPYLTYQDCLLNCPGEDKCEKCCRSLSNGQIISLLHTTYPCVCPEGYVEVECDTHEPCVQNVSCAQGYHWSFVYCECVCTQNVSCAPGFSWSYDTCKCEPIIIGPHDDDHHIHALIGAEGEMIVKVAEYVEKPINEVTFNLYQAIETLEKLRKGDDSENKTRRCLSCGGTEETIATCLLGGCLSYQKYKKDGSGLLKWVPNETYGAKTYNCVNGTCIEIDGEWGAFTSYRECRNECADIGSDGKLPTIQNLLPQNSETVNETNETNGEGTYVVPETRTVSQRYESKEIINPINGEYQVACVPATTEASSQFDSLEACVESGKGGYLVNNTTNAVNFFGFNLLTDAYTSIPYCCQSYISKTTDELTKDNCIKNCFSNETWWPLFNMNGINLTKTDVKLSYLSSNVIPSLVNSKRLTVTKDIRQYQNNGYFNLPIYSPGDVRGPDGTIIGYIDGLPVFNTIEGALAQAVTEGCSGYHTHMINNKQGFMACESHTSYKGNGPKEVDYDDNTQPTPSNTTTTQARTTSRMINAPRTTPTPRTGGGMSSGGGMSGGGSSSGGGY